MLTGQISLTPLFFPYHPLLPAGSSNYILCPHRADISSCWLVVCRSLTHLTIHGLFSPLLERRDFAACGRSILVLSEQYETSYLFYLTLSFLCNIICYQISVFVFSLVTLSGATTVVHTGTSMCRSPLKNGTHEVKLCFSSSVPPTCLVHF